jgi:purine-cytosine permease-like protein
MWVFICGLIVNVGTIVLSVIGTLGFSPTQQLIAIIAGNAILYAAGAYMKYQGTSVVGNSADVGNTGVASPR